MISISISSSSSRIIIIIIISSSIVTIIIITTIIVTIVMFIIIIISSSSSSSSMMMMMIVFRCVISSIVREGSQPQREPSYGDSTTLTDYMFRKSKLDCFKTTKRKTKNTKDEI